jgi:hypothetical protein
MRVGVRQRHGEERIQPLRALVLITWQQFKPYASNRYIEERVQHRVV